VTVKLLLCRTRLEEGDFERLANSFARTRKKHGFLLTAWVFLARSLARHYSSTESPDHFPALKSEKTSSMIGINVRRREAGELWQERFFDRALRTVREYHEKVECIHSNPVRRGLVENPEGWKWSNWPEFSGVSGVDQERFCGLRIDRVPLLFDVHTRI